MMKCFVDFWLEITPPTFRRTICPGYPSVFPVLPSRAGHSDRKEPTMDDQHNCPTDDAEKLP